MTDEIEKLRMQYSITINNSPEKNDIANKINEYILNLDKQIGIKKKAIDEYLLQVNCIKSHIELLWNSRERLQNILSPEIASIDVKKDQQNIKQPILIIPQIEQSNLSSVIKTSNCLSEVAKKLSIELITPNKWNKNYKITRIGKMDMIGKCKYEIEISSIPKGDIKLENGIIELYANDGIDKIYTVNVIQNGNILNGVIRGIRSL